MNTIRGLVAHAPSKVRGAAVELASQCDRYFGWLLLATNQGKQAVDYFDSAISLATETNEPTLFAHALSFRAYAALLADQPGTTACLSSAARRDASVYLPMRAFDAYQEAQALATENDRTGATEVLAEAHELAAGASEDTSEAPSSAYWYTPSFLRSQYGLVLIRLGRYQEAAELLAVELDAWPPEIKNSEWASSYQVELDRARAALYV